MKTFEKAIEIVNNLHFTIIKQDLARPWGGFLVIDESQASLFAKYFFPEENIEQLKLTERLSPKILIVAPYKRLSWQYHHRRAEIWRCIDGAAGVVTSLTDIEGEQKILHKGDCIKLQQGERHRLIGLDDWCIIAEIWQHTDANHLSDEDDIIRLQDDFGRQKPDFSMLT